MKLVLQAGEYSAQHLAAIERAYRLFEYWNRLDKAVLLAALK